LTEFIRAHSHDTDIFCFEEVEDVVVSAARTALPQHCVVADQKPHHSGPFRQATFFRNSMIMRSSAPVLPGMMDAGLGLYTEFAVGNKALHLINYHGSSAPREKLDSESRLAASRGLIDFMAPKQGPRVIGGDFNVLPDTRSVRMFEEHGYTNLIVANGVKTTRNRLAWDRYPAADKQDYADYVFTGPEVEVTHFEVIANEVSDHLPMVLDIELTT
jgi:endonuclease/exonuclease/phosphatase family metal-dependent hydrolase